MDLLLRCWTRRIGIIADIENFLQVGLNQKKEMSQNFYGSKTQRNRTPDQILIHCFARIPFRIISNPFLLGATIKHHLEKEINQILKDIYVNNLITMVESE